MSFLDTFSQITQNVDTLVGDADAVAAIGQNSPQTTYPSVSNTSTAPSTVSATVSSTMSKKALYWIVGGVVAVVGLVVFMLRKK